MKLNKKEIISFIKKKLLTKYRLVIMNDSTYEEKLSFRLSRMNVFILTSSVSFFLIILTVIIISFSSLREYIPGYSNVDDRKKLYDLSLKADSMQKIIYATTDYMDSLLLVLSSTEFIDRIDYQELSSFSSSVSESTKPQAEIVSDPFYKSIYFYKPIEGVLTQRFLPAMGSLGIGISSPQESNIKAVREGTVILSRWTSQNGNIIAIQHQGEIVSIYKRLSTPLKREGDKVIGGEVIAISGKTSEKDDSNLFFELWINGVAVNPAIFLNY